MYLKKQKKRGGGGGGGVGLLGPLDTLLISSIMTSSTFKHSKFVNRPKSFIILIVLCRWVNELADPISELYHQSYTQMLKR